MTMTAEPQTFEEAVARFEVFLKENGYSVTLIWFCPADVLSTSEYLCRREISNTHASALCPE